MALVLLEENKANSPFPLASGSLAKKELEKKSIVFSSKLLVVKYMRLISSVYEVFRKLYLFYSPFYVSKFKEFSVNFMSMNSK